MATLNCSQSVLALAVSSDVQMVWRRLPSDRAQGLMHECQKHTPGSI